MNFKTFYSHNNASFSYTYTTGGYSIFFNKMIIYVKTQYLRTEPFVKTKNKKRSKKMKVPIPRIFCFPIISLRIFRFSELGSLTCLAFSISLNHFAFGYKLITDKSRSHRDYSSSRYIQWIMDTY